jgi:Domain of unknown function (DUF1707)/Domain of unknown function (DUF4190)
MAADPQPGSVPDAAEVNMPAEHPPAGASATQAATPFAAAGPVAMTQPPAMLAGTGDRERAIDGLKAGFAEGRLTRAEYDERVARAHAARTYVELAELVADLPVGPAGIVMHYPAAPYPPPDPPTINYLAVGSLICGLAEIPTLGVSAVPAVILGYMARKQIRQTGERGEGLAVAGLILGGIVVACFFAAVLGIMIWLMLPPAPGTGGPIGS